MSTPALALTAALFVLSVARVTRLINSDRVFDPVRVVVARRQRRWRNLAAAAPDGSEGEGQYVRRLERWETVEYYIGCPWCVSMWAAGLSAWIPLDLFGLEPGWLLDGRRWWYAAGYVAVVLATSFLCGITARWYNDETIDVVDE